MRVTFISGEWRRTGGIASYLHRLAHALVARGDSVQIVHGDRTAPVVPGVRDDCVPGCTLYGQPRKEEAAATAGALHAIRAFAPDIVHVQGCNNFRLEQAVRDRYRATKTLHVYDYCPSNTKFHHGPDRECVYPTGAMCLPRMGYLSCTTSRRPTVWMRMQRRVHAANRNNGGYAKLIVASAHVRRHALATGYRPDQVEVIPYFVEDEPASAPEPRVILTGGRLVREKGIDLFLAALAQVPRPWRAVVAGDGLEAARLRAQAQAAGLAGDVEFAGWQDEAGMAALYRRASVVVMPSRWPEPSGIIGLEAMAHARPVVAFATGGIPEWLADGETGLLAPPLDVAALARAIGSLVADEAAARRMGDAGRARARQVFSPGPHLARVTALYGALPEPR
jgi:glycosyltransferase involved in cell wall biosynthesis